MMEVKSKFQSKYSAIVEANRLESLADDKNFLPVYASSNAKIYPYQIMAARFALRSDYLQGCILCDEASLGKTYEALLVACQKWYEGKPNILVILPPNLVPQWRRKLEKDFPTVPFVFWNNSKTLPDEVGIIITTYDIATRHALAVKEREWDLVIFDEADVLSKPENKMVQTLKDAVGDAYKLLLTPTPITMSIMDIYWLIHFIDESVLPDADWFYKRYFRQPERYKELTEWVSQFCFRTLKVQTTDYVNFTRRIPITVDYELSKEEKLIYKLVSAYILSDDKAAYPEMDSYNLNLLFFKSLSSSPRAFSNILDGAIKRTYGHEKAILEEIQKLTDDIYINSKTAELLKILKTTFNHLKSMKVKQKAIIYVEHSLTFDYLYKIFLGQGYNTIKYKDNDSIEQFRFDDEIQILIANDEASKGIDLEFCPVVVNYDLPYDSVKIEQRICRCHRQGQDSDVLVINMLSKENFADVRILELINKRTLQFNGIFGMSDDIVGNFDTKIKEVLQNFRSSTEVQEAFKTNLAVNKEANEELVDRTEDILFTTFTKSIADKVSINPKYMEDKIDEINKDLWEVVKYYFLNIKEGWYEIDDENKTLKLIEGYNRPYLFSYKDDRFLKDYKGYQQYGMNKDFSPARGRIALTSIFAKGILKEMDMACPQEAKIYVNSDIEPVEIGYYNVGITSKDNTSHKHILIGQTKDGRTLSDSECRELLNLPVVKIEERNGFDTIRMGSLLEPFEFNLNDKISKDEILQEYFKNKEGSIAYEVEKLRMLAGRKKSALELNLTDLKTEIETMKKQLNSKNSDRLEELKLTKQLKLKQKELLKKEEGLFFDKAQVDVETDEAIQELTNDYNFNVIIGAKFKLQIVKAE